MFKKAFLISLLFILSANFALAVDRAESTLKGLNDSVKADGGKFQGVAAYGDSVKDPSISGGSSKAYLYEKIGTFLGIALSTLGLLFFVLVLYAGFKWMMARGNDSEANKAKDLIYDAVIGLVIVAGAYLITQFIGGQLFK